VTSWSSAPLPRFGDRRATRIGLLGGSFNPAHGGHLHVARMALRRLGLDQVWLLVSPGNPLKPRRGMAPLAVRLAGARAMVDGRRIVATAIERDLGTRYSVDTARKLRRLFPRARFVWLLGADNLVQLSRWRRWTDLAAIMPLAVVARPGAVRAALAGKAARRLHSARRPVHEAAGLADRAPPAWVFLPVRLHGGSATAIRAARGEWS
jgi:nicotinate-nucleotide adenylyltransferase